MKYKIEIWSIGDLIEKFEKKTLNLNPEYQRRFIWTLKDQQTLIESILKGYAIPNIFLFLKDGQFEVVDGQQRIRTILGFYKQVFKTQKGEFYDEESIGSIFKNYLIPVTVINAIDEGESIEEFYSLVNSAGIHLNRPELKKAEYFDTNLLKLVNDLCDNEKFKSLSLFTELTTRRMNDMDFVSELVTLMKFGITDKKKSVDKLFEVDLSDKEVIEYSNLFNDVMDYFIGFNQFYKIKSTRYKQRNDFYTLFDLVKTNMRYGKDILNRTYELLVLFNDFIVPSNEDCEPFQEYAFNCISQSNSKNARETRRKIFNDLFFNKENTANKAQKKVLKFFGLSNEEGLEKCHNDELITFNLNLFKKKIERINEV